MLSVWACAITGYSAVMRMSTPGRACAWMSTPGSRACARMSTPGERADLGEDGLAGAQWSRAKWATERETTDDGACYIVEDEDALARAHVEVALDVARDARHLAVVAEARLELRQPLGARARRPGRRLPRRRGAAMERQGRIAGSSWRGTKMRGSGWLRLPLKKLNLF